MNLQEKIRQAQRSAAENIVIENLKANGLIKIDQIDENHSVEVNDMEQPERLNDYASRYAHLQDVAVVERMAEENKNKPLFDKFYYLFPNKHRSVFGYNEATECVRVAEEYASLRVQQAQGWISVKDRLPENNKPVLGLANKGNFQCVVQFTNGWDLAIEDEDNDGDFNYDRENGDTYMKEGWYEECEQYNGIYDNVFIKRNVTHWRELPEPPK